MNRDHLLGCRQYIPDVADGECEPPFWGLRSVRQERELQERWWKLPGRDSALMAFEEGDHTPAEMKQNPKNHLTRGLVNAAYPVSSLPRIVFYKRPVLNEITAGEREVWDERLHRSRRRW